MQLLGMDPAREDWDAWTVNVRDNEFQKGVFEFNPSLFEYFQQAGRNTHEWRYNPSGGHPYTNVKKYFKDRDVEALGGISLEVKQANSLRSSVHRDVERALSSNC